MPNESMADGASGDGRGGEPDRLGIVNAGLCVKSVGETLAEIGRQLEQVAPNQSAAEFAALDPVIAAIIGNLETIRIAARAEVRRFLAG